MVILYKRKLKNFANMKKLVLLRHGESEWNLQNRFTGWTDVGLTEKGRSEAGFAGEILKNEGFVFDVVHASILKRAILTLEICLEKMGIEDITINNDWRLNERHYGALQGLNKTETANKYGDEQVLIWRRSYTTRPPELSSDDSRHPKFDPKYKSIDKKKLPSSECLKDSGDRFLPYWEDSIKPDLKSGRRVLIVAHGNSLRALVKNLDNISDDEILKYNIPTGTPLIYELDNDLVPTKNYFLGDQEKIKAAMSAVASQGKAK